MPDNPVFVPFDPDSPLARLLRDLNRRVEHLRRQIIADSLLPASALALLEEAEDVTPKGCPVRVLAHPQCPAGTAYMVGAGGQVVRLENVAPSAHAQNCACAREDDRGPG